MTALVVLAAGLASRYGGDKQLEGVGPNGELLLEYALHDAWQAGCRRAVLVIREELRAALEGGGAHAVAGYPLAATLTPHGGVSRALCRTDGHGRLLGIEERTGIERDGARIRDDRGVLLAPDAPVSMNLWAFRDTFFDELEHAFVAFLQEQGADPAAELRIPDVVHAHVARGGEVEVVPAAGEWFGMTFAADRETVRARLAALTAAGHYPRALRPG